MPISPTYPGIYIEELPSSAHSITAAPTSITVFVGYVHPFQGECMKRKLWGQATRIFTFDDYVRIFGGLYNNESVGRSEVGYAVNQFFLNGGSDAYVVGLQPTYHDSVAPNTTDVIRGATQPLSGIQFTATQLTDDQNSVRVMISNVRKSLGSTNGNDTADILISYGSFPPEMYRGVKLIPGTDAFIEARLARSQLVTVAPAGAGATKYPASFTVGAPLSIDLGGMPKANFYVQGSHEPTVQNAADFDAVFQANTSLDKVDIFNLLVIPGVSDSGIWSNALAFCERKLAFLIMDPPANYGADPLSGPAQTIQDFVTSSAMPISPNAALYFPYLKTPDPVTGDTIVLPPSGSVAGIYARTDVESGVWKAPAGLKTSIRNTTGVVDEGRMTDMRQGTVNLLGVNVLRSFPGSGTVVWGARTTVTKSVEQWRYVPVRRTALFIEQTLLRNLGWVVFEPNDEPLWSAIRISIEAFMLSLFRQSAFQGSTPSQAFLVRCDATTTTDQDIAQGIVNILVGFRPLKPAEFVIIKIAQLAGQTQT